MPTPTASQLGPLAPLVGTWEGDDGLDVSFHTEVGYWLWDASTRQVMRCFMVPRGSTLIAGGTVEPDARAFTLVAEVGSETYGILSNLHLAEVARTTRFECAITTGDGTFGYAETTTVDIAAMGGTLAHTDTNTLVRIPDDGN